MDTDKTFTLTTGHNTKEYKCAGYYFGSVDPDGMDIITGLDMVPSGVVSRRYVSVANFRHPTKMVEKAEPKYFVAYRVIETSDWRITSVKYESLDEFGDVNGSTFKCVLLKE